MNNVKAGNLENQMKRNAHRDAAANNARMKATGGADDRIVDLIGGVPNGGPTAHTIESAELNGRLPATVGCQAVCNESRAHWPGAVCSVSSVG